MSTKKSVLELLESQRGKNISGESIAKQLHVTRNAVWKAIKELEKDGYKIQATTNKGYRLYEDNDILSVEGMLPFLSTREVSQKIKIHSSLESTNKTAKELAIAGAGHVTIVIADHQTSGRGRFDRNFYSPGGQGIYMSFILRPSKHNLVDNPTLITSFAAVAVCKAIEKTTGKFPQIKWVNDIFLDGKKICGILTEAVTDFETSNIQWIVLGIGINFTMPDSGFPEELKNIAGAIFSGSKPTITRNHLISELINQISEFQKEWGSKNVFLQYKKRLFILGKRVVVTELGGLSFDGIAVDIDDTGRLIIKKECGKTLSLSAGEVSLHMNEFDSR